MTMTYGVTSRLAFGSFQGFWSLRPAAPRSTDDRGGDFDRRDILNALLSLDLVFAAAERSQPPLLQYLLVLRLFHS